VQDIIEFVSNRPQCWMAVCCNLR